MMKFMSANYSFNLLLPWVKKFLIEFDSWLLNKSLEDNFRKRQKNKSLILVCLIKITFLSHDYDWIQARDK